MTAWTSSSSNTSTERGCGKTTVGRTILNLYKPTDGEIWYDGKLIKTKNDIKEFRKKATMVFQDPYSSLNPRMTVSDIIGEPLDIHKLYKTKEERRERILELMSYVGLNSEQEKAVTPAVQAAMEAKYGLDKPLGVQYLTYLKDITRFDFGPSLKLRGRNITDIIVDGMKTSIKLGVIAAFIALAFGVVFGSIAALRRNKIIDRIIMIITTAFVSMPSFIMGSLLLIVFSTKLGWLPANGAQKNGLILPVITLSLYPMAYITRLTRSSMLEVLGQDYIRTAKAKGVSGVKIIFGHALKNSLIPVITYFGPMLAYIVTGSLVVEQIFAVPGIGRAFVNSITGRDYPLVMGTTIVLATLIVFMNLVGDVMYKIVDPRITLE